MSRGTTHHNRFPCMMVGFIMFAAGALGVLPGGCPGPDDGTPGACVVLSTTDIVTDTTLAAGCYIVESSIDVSDGAVLTLAPGVTLKFAQGTKLTVWSDSALAAQGTADNPIVLTGAASTRGYWDGVEFYSSNSSDNALEYVTIEYGGQEDYANLLLTGTNSRVSVRHCTLRESAGCGFYLNGTAVVTAFDHNTITRNQTGAGDVTAECLGDLSDTSSYTGNDVDFVLVRGGDSRADGTWPALDVPYLIDASIDIVHNITLAAGARLTFMQDVGMTVWQNASLAAIGTADQPIVLTGNDTVRGFWDGLAFYSSNSSDNALEYVTIEYGGQEDYANLLLTGTNSRVSVRHCTLRESAGCGFYLNGTAVVTAFDHNTITRNQTGAGDVTAECLGDLSDTSSYTGNDVDFVLVRGGDSRADGTWPALDVPYLIDASIDIVHNITFAAGARLTFMQDVGMTVWQNASLAAIGTADQPIVLTGHTQVPGFWDGLQLYGTNSDQNVLQYVTIEYGGQEDYANLLLTGTNPRATVQNCTFQHSAGWGVWLAGSAVVNNDLATVNTFNDNAAGDVYQEP